MPRPTLALIADLADAIALGDPEQAFLAGVALAARIGDAAAAAVGRALAEDARPLAAVLERGPMASCA